MKSFHDEAIVLLKKPVREKDELVVLLTKRQGKMAVMSYGSRDPKSRKAGVVELFNTVTFEARQGKLPLPVLQQIKPLRLRAFALVHADHEDLSIFYRASSILKFVNDQLEDLQSVQNVYSDLNVALDFVQEPVSELLFRVKFLQDMGFLPDLSKCCVCQEVLGLDDDMVFFANYTGFAHKKCCQISPDNEIMIKPVDSSFVKIMKHYQQVPFHEALQVSVAQDVIDQLLELLSSGRVYH
jgi:DNA repair protein RecO